MINWISVNWPPVNNLDSFDILQSVSKLSSSFFLSNDRFQLHNHETYFSHFLLFLVLPSCQIKIFLLSIVSGAWRRKSLSNWKKKKKTFSDLFALNWRPITRKAWASSKDCKMKNLFTFLFYWDLDQEANKFSRPLSMVQIFPF